MGRGVGIAWCRLTPSWWTLSGRYHTVALARRFSRAAQASRYPPRTAARWISEEITKAGLQAAATGAPTGLKMPLYHYGHRLLEIRQYLRYGLADQVQPPYLLNPIGHPVHFLPRQHLSEQTGGIS